MMASHTLLDVYQRRANKPRHIQVETRRSHRDCGKQRVALIFPLINEKGDYTCLLQQENQEMQLTMNKKELR
jgi:hypothetical protein